MNVLAYWGARTGIFVAVLIVLWSVGWRDILSVIAAFIVGWLISYLVLPHMRQRANAQMEGWVNRSHARQHSEDSVEDAEAEGIVASAQHGGVAPSDASPSDLTRGGGLKRDTDREQ